MTRTHPENGALRITMQYRDKRRMVYELEAGEAQLVVRIWPDEPSSGGLGAWAVEALSGRHSGAVAVARSRATRVEALREVASAWADNGVAHGAARIDWQAVENVLNAVRAL